MVATGRMPNRRQKYGAVRTGGYASKAEAYRAHELRLLQAAGKISLLKEQPSYEIQPDGCQVIRYRPDFSYVDEEKGVLVAEDVKGFATAEFRIKAKLFRWAYPDIDFRIIPANQVGRP